MNTELFPDYCVPQSSLREEDFKRAKNNSMEVVNLIKNINKDVIPEIKNKFSVYKEFKCKSKIQNFDFYLKLLNAIEYIRLYLFHDVSKESYYFLRTMSQKLDDLNIVVSIIKETQGDLRINHTTAIRMICEPYTDAILSLIGFYDNCFNPSEDLFMSGIGSVNLNEKPKEEILLNETTQTSNF